VDGGVIEKGSFEMSGMEELEYEGFVLSLIMQ
jgi:hypothetical protein